MSNLSELAAAAIVSKLGAGVYFAHAPKSAAKPYTVFHLTCDPERAFSGVTGEGMRLQVSCFSDAATATEANDRLAAVKTALEGQALTITGHVNTVKPKQMAGETIVFNEADTWQATAFFYLKIK